MGLLDKLKSTFQKTSSAISLALTGKKINENFYQEIEDALIMADVGVQTSMELSQKLAKQKFPGDASDIEVKKFLRDEIANIVRPYENDTLFDLTHFPEIILVIGVNGNGKTTTVAKMAYTFKKMGKSPLLIAADTFRAAAVEQLKYWGKQIQVDVVSGEEQADAAGVVFNGIQQAQKNNNSVVIIDTAGRMQNREDLLAELEKIKRVIKKLDNSGPHKTILVLDGIIGQAAHMQVDTFLNKIGIDGLIVTKLDSNAKGGAIVALTQKYNTAIYAIGTGEGIEDLQPFSSEAYANAILGV